MIDIPHKIWDTTFKSLDEYFIISFCVLSPIIKLFTFTLYYDNSPASHWVIVHVEGNP